MNLSKGTRIGGLVALDVIAVNLSIWAASTLGQLVFNIRLWDMLLACLIYIMILHLFMSYTSLWEKAGIDELLQLALGVTTSAVFIELYLVFMRKSFQMGAFTIMWATLLFISSGARFMYRGLRHLKNRTLPGLYRPGAKPLTKVLIIGAGDTSRMLLKDMAEGNTYSYRPVALIDDNPSLHGMHLNGVRIIGGRGMIEDAVGKYKVDEIIVAIPSASPADQGEILKICSRTGRKVRIIPGIIDLLSGKVSAGKIRDIKLEDLLGREPVTLDEQGISGMIEGKVVLVTGGAGSIGSELVRQCVRFNPRKVVVLDVAENRMYMLAQEAKRMKGHHHLATLVGSVRDAGRLDHIFAKYKPDIVFHAAAHKHVTLMEESASEAVKNNISGTFNVARAAVKHGTGKLVFISTDKAVNPTSVMGASKRFCEFLVASMKDKASTRFASVRFGNVLGSDGSVVPIFNEQIKAGGPVTVTHPDITRYFMLISEAVLLVLQAASMMEGDELFVLDMGTPVRIDDMARDLIRLHGLEPGKDIEIQYTGLRPGEKMYEELFYDNTSVGNTAHDKVFVAKKRAIVPWDELDEKRELLVSMAKMGMDAEVAQELMAFVKEAWKGNAVTAEAGAKAQDGVTADAAGAGLEAALGKELLQDEANALL